MKRTLRMTAGAALIIALVTGMMALTFWSDRTVWPDFPTSSTGGSAPQMVMEVERDYGWRIADRIPVTLYIKQQPGTTIDINTMAIEGDFIIAGQPQIFVRENKDGSRFIKVRLDVQTFNARKSWDLNANMSYRVNGKVEDSLVKLPGLKLYASPTWDGRERIEEGKQETVQGYHAFVTAAILLAAVLGLLVCMSLIRHWRDENEDTYVEPEPKLGPRAIARRDFDLVWSKIVAGDVDEENYREIERVIRKLYRIEARTVREIAWELYNHPYKKQTLTIIILCDRVLYQKMVLSDKEHEAILNSFNEMIPPVNNTLAVVVERKTATSAVKAK